MIDRASGNTIVTRKYKGWQAVATDLHRGNRGHVERNNFDGPRRPTGLVGSYVLDAVSILMIVIALTGLVLWSSLKSRGKWSRLVILAGGCPHSGKRLLVRSMSEPGGHRAARRLPWPA